MKLCRVTWLDSKWVGGSWKFLDEIDTQPLQVESVGWIIEDTPNSLVLVHNRGGNGRDDTTDSMGAVVIPRGCVVTVEELTNVVIP